MEIFDTETNYRMLYILPGWPEKTCLINIKNIVKRECIRNMQKRYKCDKHGYKFVIGSLTRK